MFMCASPMPWQFKLLSILLLNGVFNFFPTFQEPECCAGFYGPPCHPCPGPFDNACNGNLNGKVQYEI